MGARFGSSVFSRWSPELDSHIIRQHRSENWKANMDKTHSENILRSLLIYSVFVVSILRLLVGLTIHLVRAAPVASATIASLIFGIIVISVLLALLPHITEIETLKFGPNSFEIKLKKLENEAAEIRDTAELALDEVIKFIFLAMPWEAYLNIKKIASVHFDASKSRTRLDLSSATCGITATLKLVALSEIFRNAATNCRAMLPPLR
jgi:hypothetical protein